MTAIASRQQLYVWQQDVCAWPDLRQASKRSKSHEFCLCDRSMAGGM